MFDGNIIPEGTIPGDNTIPGGNIIPGGIIPGGTIPGGNIARCISIPLSMTPCLASGGSCCITAWVIPAINSFQDKHVKKSYIFIDLNIFKIRIMKVSYDVVIEICNMYPYYSYMYNSFVNYLHFLLVHWVLHKLLKNFRWNPCNTVSEQKHNID
jgi:hypothetical protein